MLDSRAQLMACSSVVTMTFSSLNRPSKNPIGSLLSVPWGRILILPERSAGSESCPTSTGKLGSGRGPHRGLGRLPGGRRRRGRGRRLGGGQPLGGGAAHPVDVAAPPQVGET